MAYQRDFINQNFSKIQLAHTNLEARIFKFTILAYADLRDCNLRYAEMDSCILAYANLQGADLSYASLDHCDLSYADLRGVKLIGANLKFAVIVKVKLDGAVYDNKTTFPDNFAPSSKGMVFVSSP